MLIELDRTDLEQQVLQAESALAGAEARLATLRAGPRQEIVATADANLRAARARMESLEAARASNEPPLCSGVSTRRARLCKKRKLAIRRTPRRYSSGRERARRRADALAADLERPGAGQRSPGARLGSCGHYAPRDCRHVGSRAAGLDTVVDRHAAPYQEAEQAQPWRACPSMPSIWTRREPGRGRRSPGEARQFGGHARRRQVRRSRGRADVRPRRAGAWACPRRDDCRSRSRGGHRGYGNRGQHRRADGGGHDLIPPELLVTVQADESQAGTACRWVRRPT